MFRCLILLMSLLAAPIATQAQTFDCKPQNYSSHGFVSTRLILALDRKANAGSAFDYYIKQVHKTPIPVSLRKRDENSYEFSWKLRNVDVGNEGSAILSYKATLFLKDLRFVLRGRLHGYDNNIHASGICKLVK